MKHTDPNYVDKNYVRERYEMFPNNPAYRYLAQAHGVIPYPKSEPEKPKPETTEPPKEPARE